MIKMRKMVKIREIVFAESLIFILYYYYNINNIILVYKLDINSYNIL